MKIYEIGTGYTPIPATMGAATEIVVEELVKSFQKLDADISLIDIQTQQRIPNTLPLIEVPVPSQFTGTDVQLGLLHKLKRVVYSLSLARTLRSLLKKSSGKVILHFHNQYNMYFFRKLVSKKLRSKAQIAYTVHSYIWAGEWADIHSTIQKRYFQEIDCVQHADHVLVLNEKTAAHFTQHLGVPLDKIKQITNGVNTNGYHPLTSEDKAQCRSALKLEGKKVIFQVGSICDRKNQLGAVQMLKDYLKDHPDVVYMYAGGVIDTEYQAQIQSYANENNIASQVCYVGELCPGEELNRYYNTATVSIFPSKLESFGLVIIEALSAGIPVLIADKPLFDLASGYFVYESPEDCIRQLDHLLAAPPDCNTVRQEAVAHYSWDKIASDHLNIWNA